MNTTSLYDFIMYNRLMFDDIMITKKSYTVSSFMNTTSLYDFIMYNRLMFDDIMITKKSYTVSSNFIITP